MKLHLGCGQKYLDGYWNVDFPSEEHTVQDYSVADSVCDIKTLEYPKGSIDEVRSHHFFEHFPRPVALALLCRWTDWLKPGGTLHIETPDFLSSIYRFVSPFVSFDEKEQIMRHLFGSHEAPWAVHWDAWYEERFKKILVALGYTDLKFIKSQWGATRNIEVIATRGAQLFTNNEYREIVQDFLSGSLIKEPVKKGKVDLTTVAPSEVQMLNVWLKDWEETYLNSYVDEVATLKNDLINLKNYRSKCFWPNLYGAIPYLAKLNNAKTVVEVGVAYGYHAEFILENLPQVQYFGVDPYAANYDPQDPFSGDVKKLFQDLFDQKSFDRLFKAVQYKLNKLSESSKLVRKSSVEASSQFADGSVDLIYIDGDHTYKSVMNDLNSWWSKVNPEHGIICGDDLNWKGVKDACDDFFGEKKLKYFTIHKVGFDDSPIWFYSFNCANNLDQIELEKANLVIASTH